MVAVLAFVVGRLRLFAHAARHVLTLSTEPHRGLRDTRYDRGRRYPLVPRSVELRCVCGRVYFQWWTNSQPKGRVRR